MIGGNTVNFSIPALFKWAGAIILAEWLQIPGLMRALVVCMLIDYATGLASAYVRKQLSAELGIQGLIKKAMILVLLLMAHIAEKAAGIELNIEQIGALAYLVNEMVSIVENCALAGVPIPSQLVEALLAIKKLKASNATPQQISELGATDVKVEALLAVKVTELPVEDQPDNKA